MKTKDYLLLTILLIAIIFVVSCAPQQQTKAPETSTAPSAEKIVTDQNKQQTNANTNAKDDFGCWPPSCSSIPDATGKLACEDWKAGKSIMWPSDCSMMQQSSCAKLCDFEKKNNPQASQNVSDSNNKQQYMDQNQQQPTIKGDAYTAAAQKIVAHELPSLLTLEFKDGVLKEDEEKFREGFKTMDFFLNEWFGHSIIRKSAIRVSATGKESWWADESGTKVGVMGMQDPAELIAMKPYAQFEPFADTRVRYMTHEFVHLYQIGQGCHGVRGVEGTFGWFTEGEAEWLSFKAQRESGKLKSDMSVEQWASQGLQQRLQRGISMKPLRECEGAGCSKDAYPYFTLAIEFLMKDKELKTLDSFCANIGNGQIGSVAFQNAFGVSLEKFYSDFELYQKMLSTASSSSTSSSSTYPNQPSPSQG